MDIEQRRDSDGITDTDQFGRTYHCVDVGQYFGRGDVGGGLAEPARCLGPQEASAADLEAFDPR
ncbi:hypothetical protein [Parafrankia sp. CH37]|uniref:hypothetical protein n=1 Tax=Parafrankia sp. CH37 TaxID=683308 RepID=UPI00201BCF3C|nr:hypothetical protein [Parafrankia sp. CH37]